MIALLMNQKAEKLYNIKLLTSPQKWLTVKIAAAHRIALAIITAGSPLLRLEIIMFDPVYVSVLWIKL